MKIIVVVDKNWAIGKDNNLLFSLKQDMEHFKQTTLNKTVVMGRKTYDSLPGKRPLPKRKNIILGSQAVEGAIFASDLPNLFKILKQENTDDVFIMGGASVYRTLLPYCSQAIITKVDAEKQADTFFENLDLHQDWQIESKSESILDGEYTIQFVTYKNLDVKQFLA